MHITFIKIKNFRGLDLCIDNLQTKFLIMGRNDTGKSNLCFAIRKVLDPAIRRIPFNENDSTNHNKENIEIEIKMIMNNITISQRSLIGKWLEPENDNEVLYVKLVAEYSQELMVYDEHLIFGNIDKKTVATNITNELDKILDIIYIEPNYNYERNMNNYFSYQKKNNESHERTISEEVLNQASKMNESISDDAIIKEMTASLNNNSEFEEIFEGISFKINSNIQVSNIYKSLEISFVDKAGNSIGNMGDGRIKTLSMLLKQLSYDDEKIKILIIEEPENHLYPLLQQTYSKLIESLKMNQFIFTSHSPYIVDFKKMEQIIRLIREGNLTTYRAMNIEENTFAQFGYLMNREIGEMLFYDTILLVEGVSEKYFYNTLAIKDKSFQKFLTRKKMGIFCVNGVDFFPVKKFLNGLGIQTYIKTDNDIFKVPYKPLKRYAGIERVLNCLDKNGSNELATILGVKEIDQDTFRFDEKLDSNADIECKMIEIQELFERYGIYLSIGHDGFEEDFLKFIGQSKIDNNDMEYLKKAKLKNLHNYIIDGNISFEINDGNKSSILLRFMDE
ncbi:ATP-dependent nuclease [Faecalibacillus intestinalis]|uniref:ATP-dependent nuclease n=1 Tax=Faecalibacillus intestinalis TaxID=1982626 RepID=UPI002686BA28